MLVVELDQVVKRDVRELGVIEVSQDRVRRGMVHRQVVVGADPEVRLFPVAFRADLAPHVRRRATGWHRVPPLVEGRRGGNQQSRRGQR